MPKVKVPRKSTTVDMTAMTDVAFLLLTFFMLATKFKPDEPVMVDTPSSVSMLKLPEKGVLLLTVDKDSRVFFTIDGQQIRAELLKRMGKRYNVTFTDRQIQEFALMSAFGVSVKQLPQLLDMKPEERLRVAQAGIPSDSANNELSDWIFEARHSANDVNGTKVRVAVKGDQLTNYPIIRQIIKTLGDRKVHQFNFITTMERAQ